MGKRSCVDNTLHVDFQMSYEEWCCEEQKIQACEHALAFWLMQCKIQVSYSMSLFLNNVAKSLILFHLPKLECQRGHKHRNLSLVYSFDLHSKIILFWICIQTNQSELFKNQKLWPMKFCQAVLIDWCFVKALSWVSHGKNITRSEKDLFQPQDWIVY